MPDIIQYAMVFAIVGLTMTIMICALVGAWRNW